MIQRPRYNARPKRTTAVTPMGSSWDARGESMRIGIPLRRSRTDRVSRMEPLGEALAKGRDLVRPVEAIEVSLTEAVGMVLAEPAVADVDLPPSDRAAA